MAKKTILQILPWLLLVLVVSGLLITQKQKPSLQIQRNILLNRLEHMQRLEVMQAHLLAHETVQANGLLNHSEFLIVAKGRAIYGLDLAKIQIQTDAEKKLHLILPDISVLELVLNPQDIEYLGLKKGLLTSQKTFENTKQQALRSLHHELTRQAHERSLIQEAERSAQQYLESLLDGLGIKDAKISFKNSRTPIFHTNGDAGNL